MLAKFAPGGPDHGLFWLKLLGVVSWVSGLGTTDQSVRLGQGDQSSNPKPNPIPS